MKKEELDVLLAKADAGTATINDLVQIQGATLLSLSRHATETKDMIAQLAARLDMRLDTLEARIKRVEGYTVDWVYKATIEEEEELPFVNGPEG